MRVLTPTGRQVSRSFKRKVDAEAWERAQRTDMRRREWVDPRSGDITLSAWLAEVEASKVNIAESTRQTRAHMTKHIIRHLGDWPIGNLTAEAIQRWVSQVDRAPATVHKAHAILSEAIALAVARGRIVRNPMVKIELPRIPPSDHRYLTDEEVRFLADSIDPRYRIFVMAGAYAGLRPGETLALEWRDIDANRRTVAVRGTKTAASRRTIRLPAVLVDELARHRSAYPNVRWVVHNTAGRTVLLNNLRGRQFARAVAASVGEPMRPHDLRHTHVALLIAEGMHAKGIADRLGHTSIRTTMDTYGHLLDGVEADVVDRLGMAQTWPKTTDARPG